VGTFSTSLEKSKQTKDGITMMSSKMQERLPQQVRGEVVLPPLDVRPPSPGMLEVNVNEASEVDEALMDAISHVTEAAVRHKTGVLVTRVGPGSYIVRAHPAVPYGLTRQQDE
jgi:hypothetical protein